MCHFYSLNNSVQHWLILIILAFSIRKRLDVSQYSLAHFTLILLLFYLVKCRSRSLAIYSNEFILESACIGSRKSPRPQSHWKSVTYLTVIIPRSFIDELKWRVNSEWAALGQWLWNMLLASRVNINRLHSCWIWTFWAHAVIKMMWCNM